MPRNDMFVFVLDCEQGEFSVFASGREQAYKKLELLSGLSQEEIKTYKLRIHEITRQRIYTGLNQR
jgi:hypothetical protein